MQNSPLEIPGYSVTSIIHESGHSRVYRGNNTATGAPVVIKIHPEDYPSERALASTKRAFTIGRCAACDQVIDHIALVPYRSDLALVTEDYGAVSLDRFIQLGHLPLQTRLRIAIGLADSVGRVHERNVIHKDIKPHNVVIHPQTHVVKLIDFGISSQLDEEIAENIAPERLEGTLLYISPEQTGRMNRSVDYRSDLYSLGVTLYELLTGQLPFGATDPMELIHCHIARPPVSPSEIDPEVPVPVSAVILKLLAKTAEERYLGAHGLKRDLERCLRELELNGRIVQFPIGATDVSARFQVPQKLYGREPELTRLMRAFDAAAAGGCELFLVSGYSGVGKSALIHEVQRPIAARRGYFCTGKFDQFRTNLPYVALLEALADLMRQVLTQPSDRIDRIRSDVLATLGSNAAVITAVLPELELIVGEQPAVPALGPNETQARFNRVFCSFLRVFAREEHPLVVFIDDLQWADLASLQLLSVLVADPEARYLLLLGAYRDNEVSGDHPLVETLRRITDAGGKVDRIELAPLDEGTVCELLGDALYNEGGEDLAELAALAHDKTRGNPFFLGQFLRSLHADHLLYFDAGDGRWRWELDAIRSAGITDNVADLMGRRIEQLPERTQHVLQIASCVGGAFDLETVAAVGERGRVQTARDLSQALTLGLVVPTDSSYKYVEALAELADERGAGTVGANPRYRFLHDRVQQAAHAQMVDVERQQTHLTIGRYLLSGADEAALEDRVIDIVNHMDEGRARIAGSAELVQLAELNLRAARKAKASMAVEAARKYLAVGREVLPPNAWDAQYDLALALHTETADVAYMQARFDDVAEECEITLARARTLLDKVPIYNIEIGVGIARNQYVEATRRGIEVLRLFGFKLPSNPSLPRVAAGLARVKLALGRRKPADLAHLPEMTDPQLRAAMGILMKTATNAYWATPNLVPLIAAVMVRLSIRHGNMGLSAYGYALMGMILRGLGDLNGGYAFGKLAMEVLAGTNAPELVGKTALLWDGFVRHAKDPLSTCAASLLEDYHAALDVGDVENAVYCAGVAYYVDLYSGRPLAWLQERYAPYIAAAFRSQQQHSIQTLYMWTQLVANLTDPEHVEPRLRGEYLDYDDVVLPDLQRSNAVQALTQGGAAAGTLAFLLGDLPRAQRHFAIAFEKRDASRGQAFVDTTLAYYGLVLCRVVESGESTRQDRVRLNQVRRMVRKAARFNPASYTPLHELVEAEVHRVHHQGAKASAAFGRAIAAAHEQSALHSEALACELAAHHHEKEGNADLSAYYLSKAAALYRRWGAHAKVAQLQRTHGAAIRLPTEAARSSTGTTTTEGTDLSSLDFRSVMKSVRTLSGEINLEALLSRIMDLAIQNAGAQRGVLVLERDGQMYIEAARSVGDDETTVLFTQSLEESDDLPRTIVDYTIRAQKPVLLEEALKSDLFRGDPYVESKRPRSVLCTPLLHQGRLIGLVYLENNLSAGAFTASHLTVLEILCGQAAISIQNARLYQHQRAMTDSFARFVPKQFLQQLGKPSLLDVRLGESVQRDISVLFSDLRDFTALSESMSAEDSFGLMNAYLERMEPAIQDHDGFIDKYIGDAVMALFPRSPDDAVAAAISMQLTLDDYNDKRSSAGRARLTMGIGIHTGRLMLGTVGSPSRMETTVIGDTVNLASRIEGLTGRYGTRLLISEEARARLSNPNLFNCRLVGRFRVKGRKGTATVHEVLDADMADLRERKLCVRDRFEHACQLYFRRDFAAALDLFRECLDAVGDDRLARIYAGRCERSLATAVADDWDGVEELETK